MATPAVIAIKEGNTVTWSWLNCDGVIDQAGRKLVQYYNTADAATALIALGDLSVLAESIDCPPGHSFATPEPGYTIAYKRDRGESNVDPQTSTIEMFLICTKNNIRYLFEGDTWFIVRYAELKGRNAATFEQRYHLVRVGELLAGVVE
jgi:hypothetical protein